MAYLDNNDTITSSINTTTNNNDDNITHTYVSAQNMLCNYTHTQATDLHRN